MAASRVMAVSTDRMQMDQLSLGVLATSSKENEFRLPIHPQHFDRIDPDLRARIFLEHGYGERFGVSQEHLATQVGGIRSREEIIATSDQRGAEPSD